MRSVAFIAAVLASVTAAAQELAPRSSTVGAAIDRGLTFLVEDALAWKRDHNCASCHHASLVVLAMHEAKHRGHAVDDKVLSDLMKWMAESGDGKFGLARPTSAPNAASPKAIYFSLALGGDLQPDATVEAKLKLLMTTVKSEQTGNGSWSTWPNTRPPIFGSSDESLTALATLAVLPVAATGDADAQSARDNAVRWLTEKKTDNDPQSIALRLVLWKRLGRPADECETLAGHIIRRQNDDGGWSQSNELASDAWACGQAIYALAHVDSDTSRSAISRGQEFLVKAQRTDGSWEMTSRPTMPGGEGSTNLVPITGAGSAWAVLGLARSTETSKADTIKSSRRNGNSR